uniref:Uncharacterized protein n=1 Tax=Panagrolaimus superbus TaxID=310955 RepID=A0A914YZ67_9BILA
MLNTTLILLGTVDTNSTLIHSFEQQQKLIFGFIWWKLLLLIMVGILSTLILCCVIIFTINKSRKSSSTNLYMSASEMPSHILIHPPSKSSRNKSSSMKVKLLGKRDIRSAVQDQHYPISNKKRSYWEHSLDYSNPYNPYSKRRPYFSESNYSA